MNDYQVPYRLVCGKVFKLFSWSLSVVRTNTVMHLRALKCGFAYKVII